MEFESSVQSIRNAFIREFLPTAENAWSGSTLAYHILNAVAENTDSLFGEALADAFVGQKAFYLKSGGQHLDLRIERLTIFWDSVGVKYLDKDEKHIFYPHRTEKSDIDEHALHMFIIPTGNEEEWEKIRKEIPKIH
jgi:hypothetical protein